MDFQFDFRELGKEAENFAPREGGRALFILAHIRGFFFFFF